MSYKVAVVNSTSSVGAEIINYLEYMNFPYSEVIALSKRHEIGKEISFGDIKTLAVEPIEAYDFRGTSLVFFASLYDSSLDAYKEKAIKAGSVVIDLSNKNALNNKINALIPSVNDHEFLLNYTSDSIISLPSALSTQLAIILQPLDMAYNIKRAVISTYQAVSSNGEKEAMDELYNQTKGVYVHQELDSKFFNKKISFNVLPGVGDIKQSISEEENRVMADLKKLIKEDLNILINTAYVPVFVGNSAYINIEFEKEFDLKELKDEIREVREIIIIEEGKENYSTPFDSVGEEAILISRIRKDNTVNSAISMWSSCDNLRRGVAITAVEIAQFLVENGKLKEYIG